MELQNNIRIRCYLRCRICKRFIRTLPVVPTGLLYLGNYTLTNLFQLIISRSRFFICQTCCVIIFKQFTWCDYRMGYYCSICRKYGRDAPVRLKNVSNYNKKYVCDNCLAIVTDTYYGYEMRTFSIKRFLKSIKDPKNGFSYMCELMIFPSTILKPLGKIFCFNIVDIENRMRNTNIYKELLCIICNRKGMVLQE